MNHTPIWTRLSRRVGSALGAITAIVAIVGVLATGTPAKAVVGGSTANIANAPFVVSVRINGSHAAMGTIISSTKILTVAHAVSGVSVASLSVLAGTADRTVTNCATCELRSVARVTIHPSFSNDGAAGYPNDIAVVTLASPLAFNANVNSIPMDCTGSFTGCSATIYGWGRTSTNGALPAALQQASLTVLSQAATQSFWPGTTISTCQFGLSSSTISACAGDGGAPVVCNGKLVGIVSFNQATCNPSMPTVCTKVSCFCAWINAN